MGLLFALECFTPHQRRSVEALLLSAKLALATHRQEGVTHVLVGGEGQNSFFTEDYPGAETILVDTTQLRNLSERLRNLARPASQKPACITLGTELVGNSAAIEAVRKTISRVAESDVTVLITGETGCGKECAARMVHRLSARNAMPLVALNCAAIPDTMLEGELFGYEKGAFTGAIKAYPGKVKLADGGTLALDEIGDLSPQGQAKILRAIETHEFYRLGAIKSDSFNARIVAMTNIDLAAACAGNSFRRDLYYRLAVAQVHLPPLRERREDVMPLAQHFLPSSIQEIAADAADALQSYNWPGNVRELGNVIRLAALESPDGIIKATALPSRLFSQNATPRNTGSISERQKLLDALKVARGNKSVAAKSLNWSRMTLYRKMVAHHIAEDAMAVTHTVTA